MAFNSIVVSDLARPETKHFHRWCHAGILLKTQCQMQLRASYVKKELGYAVFVESKNNYSFYKFFYFDI